MDKSFFKMETLLNSLQRFPLHKGKTTQIVFAEPHQNIALCLTFAYPEIRTANVPAYTTTFFELQYPVVLSTRFKSPYSGSLSLHSSTLSIPRIINPYNTAHYASILRNSLIRVTRLYVDNHTVNIQDFVL
jgi:hypothetical protein